MTTPYTPTTPYTAHRTAAVTINWRANIKRAITTGLLGAALAGSLAVAVQANVFNFETSDGTSVVFFIENRTNGGDN